MKILRETALSFLNVPYKWGGRNAIEGIDCSGLLQEILASVGIDPDGDQSAQGLFDFFSNPENHVGAFGPNDTLPLGTLLFYGPLVSDIGHCAFVIDQYRMLEAGGGGRTVTGRELAGKVNAFVRIRPIRWRNLRGAFLPDYRLPGLD